MGLPPPHIILIASAFTDVEIILSFMILDLMPPRIAGILASIISIADSQVLVITSSVSEDIIRNVMKMKLLEKKLVTISRITIICAGLVGLILATSRFTTFFIAAAFVIVFCLLFPD